MAIWISSFERLRNVRFAAAGSSRITLLWGDITISWCGMKADHAGHSLEIVRKLAKEIDQEYENCRILSPFDGDTTKKGGHSAYSVKRYSPRQIV